MRHLHSLLYYLVYVHPGKAQVSKEQQVESLRAQGHILDEKLVGEMGTIYHDEVDWKMFVPPLPKHSGIILLIHTLQIHHCIKNKLTK